MALPYTDATGVGSFTVRGPRGTLIAVDGEDTLTVDGRTLKLEDAPFRNGMEWFVPIKFLTTGLEQITGVDFQYEPGAPRVLAGTLRATDLAITAVGNEGETRLTIRSALGVNLRVQQLREENRVILSIDRAPMSPAEEVLDYRDASVRSVRFDDADGRSKIVVETTSQVASVRLTPTDANRTFFVDFVPESVPARPIASPPDREGLVSSDEVRVIVIDPGHGGLDGGAQASGTLEKDLTLTLARGIRRRLQREIDTTVILTRDADLELSGETRSAIANNNEADLLISLHVGVFCRSHRNGRFAVRHEGHAGRREGRTSALQAMVPNASRPSGTEPPAGRNSSEKADEGDPRLGVSVAGGSDQCPDQCSHARDPDRSG